MSEHFDCSSSMVAVTESLTYVSDTEDNLEVENDLTHELLEKLESVVEKIIASATHARDQKIVSSNILSNAHGIDRQKAERTLDATSKIFSKSDVP